MKKVIPVLLLFTTIAGRCLAQEELLDVKPAPRPANIASYTGKQDFKFVRQRIAVVDYDARNRNAKDTSSIINYDSAGRLEKYVLFEKGKRYSITTYAYPDGKNVTLVYMQNLSPRYLTFFRTRYDRQGRTLAVYHAEITNNDTTSRGLSNYTYKDGLLVKRQNFLNGKPVFVHDYMYHGADLQQAKTQNANSPASYTYVFQYDANHLLTGETEYHFYPKGIDTLHPAHFNYAGKMLVSETYSGIAGPKTQTTITYGYDPQGRINSRNDRSDTLYRNTTFTYTGPYISAVKISTNTWRAWKYGSLMRGVFTLTPMPVSYETNYFYDDKGYLIKTTEKLNGTLQWSVTYSNTYY